MQFSVTRSRLFILYFLGSFILTLIVMSGFTLFFDPLHILKPPAPYDVYDRESRYAMPGLVHYNNAQHAVLGTSIVQDFDEIYYEEQSNRSIARYFFPGGTGYEQHRLLETLLKAKIKPKRVIWGLDIASFSGDLKSLRWDYFPEYLFQKDPSALRYALSIQSFYRLLRQVPDRLWIADAYTDSSHRLRSGHSQMSYGVQGVYGSYCGGKYAARIKRLQELDFSTQSQQIESHIIAPLRQNTDTEFLVFFPPYTLIQFAEYERAGVLEQAMAFRLKLYEALQDLPHVRLYDFQSDLAIITDYKNFRDSVHGNTTISRHMIDKMVRDQDRHVVHSRTEIEQGNQRIKKALPEDLWQEVHGFCQKAGDPIQPVAKL